MQLVCDRVMQLVVEQTPPQPASVHADAQTLQPSRSTFPGGQQRGSLSSLSQENVAESVEGVSHGDALAGTGVAKGLFSHLRWRALAVLESYGGGGFRQGNRPLRLLQAWTCLQGAAYFSAAPSRVKSCQLCVTMYSACERCYEQGPISRRWLEQARALAADMPIPPDPQWLRGESGGVDLMDVHQHVASH